MTEGNRRSERSSLEGVTIDRGVSFGVARGLYEDALSGCEEVDVRRKEEGKRD